MFINQRGLYKTFLDGCIQWRKTCVNSALSSQILGFDYIHSMNSILVQHFNLKIWEVYDKTLLDLGHALLHDIIGFFLRQIGTVITVHDANAEHASIPMSNSKI